MQVRKDMWEASGMAKWFIDPRMGAETMHLYTLSHKNKEDIEAYEKAWYSNDDAKFEKCTAKSTIYCANILAGLVAKTVKNLAVEQEYTRVLRWNLNGTAPATGGFECWNSRKQTCSS